MDAFELVIPVASGDIDRMGHVNNLVYLRWVLEAAEAHWRALAPAPEQDKLLWIVLRHEIDYLKAALPGDVIRARTWVGSGTRIRFERHTELLRAGDGTLLTKARTLWCPVDSTTLRPASVSSDVRALFSV